MPSHAGSLHSKEQRVYNTFKKFKSSNMIQCTKNIRVVTLQPNVIKAEIIAGR